ncbi:MAG: Gfo/Idh/MocA family oxidoreductase [Alkalibacterium sp.]|nr:Gfo/Idh/MocA family oxidoreductase [Alkalibacterium sp.]
MTKLKLGTIGTSSITEQFIEAAVLSSAYSLEAVYSRTDSTANDFKAKFKAEKAYSDWESFLKDEDIDVIYIASPNSLHFKQAMAVLNHKKHAIVEKPMVTSLAEWDELTQAAEKNGKVVVEAARHIHEPNFIKITEQIKALPDVYGASLTYSKYSSRYDKVLSGEEPAIFSTKFAGGAANDLGIYTVYAAVSWFGKPESVHSFSQKIRTGVDGKGTAVLRYPEFDVTLNYGKINTSLQQSEVYSSEQTIVLDAITGLEQASLVDARTREEQVIDLDSPADNPLIWEARTFSEVMLQPALEENKLRMQEWNRLSRTVHEVLEDIRKQ